jgi:hypothetical protein
MDKLRAERYVSFYNNLAEQEGLTGSIAMQLAAAEISNPTSSLLYPWSPLPSYNNKKD